MVLSYLTSNFITLMLLLALAVMMLVNRKQKIPTTQLFYVLIAVLLILSILDFLNDFLAGKLVRQPAFDPVRMRTVVDAVIYMLRPAVILVELLVVLPKRRYWLLFILPAVVNAAVYASTLFGSRFAFYIDANNWHGGALPWQLVYAVQLLYVVLLAVCSVIYFGRGNRKRGIMVLTIVLMAILTLFLESDNILPGYSTMIAAICVLVYYIYLASIYQQEIRETVAAKELHIAKQELLLLRSQMDPVFISDALGAIRALAKTDKAASAAAIDSFSAYLRAHMNAIREDQPVGFQAELECVKAYLALIRIGREKAELICDLQTTGVSLPPLTLESVVEYGLRFRQDSKTVTIHTAEDGANIRVGLSVSGTEASHSAEQPASSSAIFPPLFPNAAFESNDSLLYHTFILLSLTGTVNIVSAYGKMKTHQSGG